MIDDTDSLETMKDDPSLWVPPHDGELAPEDATLLNARARKWPGGQIPRAELSSLPSNSMYLRITMRPSMQPNDFHWAMYHFCDPDFGGMKYHIHGSTGRWMTDYVVERGILGTNFLIGLIRIGSIDYAESKDAVMSSVSQEDQTLNEKGGTTCRTWLLRVLERLRAESLLDYDSINDLEREVFAFGNQHLRDCAMNMQPRPVIQS